MTSPLGYIMMKEMCWTKTNNKKEHVMYISRLETLWDHKPEIGKAAT